MLTTGATPREFRRLLTVGVAVIAMTVLGSSAVHATPNPAEQPASGATTTLVAVGDVACDPDVPGFNGGAGSAAGCRQRAVAAALRGAHPDVFAALGDLQYYDGSLSKFQRSYDPAFGDLKSITRPIPGNHEYKTPGGAGYYAYFGAAAHRETRGIYSFDVAGWHILALNSTACTASSPCGPGSWVSRWIATDIAQHPSQCLAAMWHHPIFSAGVHGNYAPMVPVWNQLNSYGTDLVLNGHDHLYQRFKPMSDASVSDSGVVRATPVADGITQFVIGTGGEDNYKSTNIAEPTVAASLAAVGTNPNPGVFGAVKFDLGPDGYSFSFVNAEGSTYSDSGSGTCRQKHAPVGVPSAPTRVEATRSGDGAITVSWLSESADPENPSSFTVNVAGTARSCVTTASSCRITGLANGQTYQIAVTANTAVGWATSPTSSVLPARAPSAPMYVTASADPVTARPTVAWNAPRATGGMPISSYVVRDTRGAVLCTSAAALTCTGPDLAEGNYRFTVTAVNAAGSSAASMVSNSVTIVAATRPSAPTVELVNRAGDGALMVTIASPVSDGGRVVTRSIATAMPTGRTCAIAGSAGSCRITGLANGTSYRVSAIAVNSVGSSGASAASQPIIAAMAPSRPTAVAVAVAPNHSMVVSWVPPLLTGGLPIQS